MSYIDNSKQDLYSQIHILEIENEMYRKQIIKLKIENNELLDRTNNKGEKASNEITNSRSGGNN